MAEVIQSNNTSSGPNVIRLMSPSTISTPREVDRDSAYYSSATGVPVSEARTQVEAGVTAGLEGQALSEGFSGTQRAVEEALQDDDNIDDVIFGMIEDGRQVEAISRFLPRSMEVAIRNNLPGAREFALDRLTRLNITAERIADRVDSMQSITDVAVNFAEVLVDPLSLYHSATYRRLTREYEALLQPTTSLEEFQQGLDRILTEAADAGFFSDENLFFFGDFLDTLGSGVYSGEQEVQEAFGALDIGLTGAFEIGPALLRGTRILRAVNSLTGSTALSTGLIARGAAGAVRDAARDTLSMIGLMRPSVRTQRAAGGVASLSITIDDPRRASTGVSAHSHMSYATPTLARGGFLSASSHTAMRQFEENSIVLDQVLDAVHRTGSIYDEAAIAEFAQQFRNDRMRLLADSGVRGIVDVEVGVDELGNIFAVDVIGRVNGQYFATERTARRAATQPGDEVVQIAPGQFAVVRRHNISADNMQTARDLGYSGDIRDMMLYRATDPERLGDGFFARWGSPLAQGDPAMTSYLFRSSTVFQSALHQMRAEIKRVTSGMPLRHIVEVYNAFEVMARSARREAFTEQEFNSWFYNEYRREPTQAQTNLYLLQQERLDTELLISTNELYRQAVDTNTRVLRSGEVDYLVRPVSAENLNPNTLIYDESRGTNVPLGEVGDRQVFRVVGDLELPTNVQYTVSDLPQVRAVRHSDFAARNAGGHRSYVVNEMQFLIKQRNTRIYADGSERELAPRTLLGVRTPEEARQAQTDINNIIEAIADEMGSSLNMRHTLDEFYAALRAFRNNPRIRAAIQENNGFNPGISSLDDLIEFALERGLDLRRTFEAVAEGQPMSRFLSGTADISNYAFALRSSTHADDVRLNAMRGGRGSVPLTSYGGTPISIRPTQDVLEGSYISALARATETAFRYRTFKGLIRSAIEAGVLKVDYAELASLPVNTQINRILADDLIDTTGARGARANIGNRLKLDLQRLQFRLQQQSYTSRLFQNAYRRAANFFYGANKIPFNRRLTGAFDRFSRDPASALRGWAFDVYLGFFNFSQYLMQASQIINIMGIAGINGMKGAALYLPFRFLLANGHDEVIDRVAKLTNGITGLTADDWRTMLRMFRESGRNIVDNNLAELTMAEDAMSNFGRLGVNRNVRSFREAGRLPYKEGELAARITAFITAFLEYVSKNGRITRARDPRAINFITNREQALTQAMGAESRQAYEQLPFMQFMTYNLRITEALLAGSFSNTKSVLTTQEKLRLAATHFAFWGAAASMPTAMLANYLTNNYETEVNEHAVRAMRSGVLDALVSWVTGADTAISARFAAGTGWYDMATSLAQEGLLSNLLGPAGGVLQAAGGPSGELAANTARTALGAIYHGINAIATGEFTPMQDDLISLARFTSSGNYTYNAYTAFRYGEFFTRRGSLVTENLDAMDSMFLMFGIPLEEVEAMYSYQGDRRFRNRWLSATQVPALNQLHEQLFAASRRGDTDRMNHYFNQIATIMNTLSPSERSFVESRVNPDFRSMTNSMMLDALMNETEAAELMQ